VIGLAWSIMAGAVPATIDPARMRVRRIKAGFGMALDKLVSAVVRTCEMRGYAPLLMPLATA
jgi:hypothetical protein